MTWNEFLISPLMIIAVSVTIAVLGLLIFLLRAVFTIDGRMDGFDKRMDSFDKRLDDFKVSIDKRFDDFNSSIENILEVKLDAKIAPINEKLGNHITDTDKKIDKLEFKIDQLLDKQK